MQLSLFSQSDWHIARVSEAQKRADEARKQHRARKHLDAKTKHWRTVQLRREVFGEAA